MSRFHDLMAADLAAVQAPAAQPGESAPAETQPEATGTPSAPAHALGEQSASQTTTPATETAETVATTPAESVAVEQSAQPAADVQTPAESVAVPQMRQTIEILKSKLDEQKPLLEPITSRFASEDEMRPFLSVVDAARERDPQQAAQKVGDGLYQMLGADRYGALVSDLASQHLDFVIEANRDAIMQRLGVTPASNEDRVFDDDDDEQPKTAAANPELIQLQQERDALKQQLAQLTGQSAAVQEQQRIASMRGTVLAPLQQAMTEVAALGAEFEGVPDRIKAEVLTQFQNNPQLTETFDTVAEMVAKGEPPHLYAKAVQTMREAVQGLTEKALHYHKRVVAAPVAQQQQGFERAKAAAERTAQVEVPRAAPSAQPVAPAPAPAPAQQQSQSLKKQLFDKSEIKAGLREMQQAGRF